MKTTTTSSTVRGHNFSVLHIDQVAIDYQHIKAVFIGEHPDDIKDVLDLEVVELLICATNQAIQMQADFDAAWELSQRRQRAINETTKAIREAA